MNSMTSTFLSSAAALGLTLAANGAYAQQPAQVPDPFEDYEAWKTGEPTPSLTPPLKGAPTQATAAPVVNGPKLKLTKGTWNLGARALFSYTGANNELKDGSSESNTTLFIRATPSLSYFIMDRLEVGGSFGWLSKSLARESGGRATEGDWAMEGTAFYHIPLSKRLSFVPGAGLGFYFGSSDNTTRAWVDGAREEIEETTDTKGVMAALYLGAAYQLGESWQLRSGLTLNALIGSETINSEDKSLSASTLHVGLPIELYYTF